MAPILNAKLALFEAKKVARGLIEKDLTMWACRRRHAVLVVERRKKDEVTPTLTLTLALALALTLTLMRAQP